MGREPKRSKAVAFKREPPDVPGELDSTPESDLFAGDNEFVSIQERRVHALERGGLKIGTLRVEGSVLDHLQLAKGQFGSVVLKDARLTGCDLANVHARRMTLLRVELVDCRLAGIRSDALEWQDVLVQNGDIRYALLQAGKFRRCEFDSCNLEESDLQGSDLTGAIFRSCTLTRADFQGAKLQGTDFRKSEIDGWLVGASDLRGAIVDPAQAMILARLLGLQIR